MSTKSLDAADILHDLTILLDLLCDKVIKENAEMLADPDRDAYNLWLYEGMKRGVRSAMEIINHAVGIH